MKLGTIAQTARERKTYSIRYDDSLDMGDSIARVLLCTASPEGLEVSPILASENRVRVVISGGVAGASYTVTVIAETAAGEQLEDTLTCRIR